MPFFLYVYFVQPTVLELRCGFNEQRYRTSRSSMAGPTCRLISMRFVLLNSAIKMKLIFEFTGLTLFFCRDIIFNSQVQLHVRILPTFIYTCILITNIINLVSDIFPMHFVLCTLYIIHILTIKYNQSY